MQALKWWQAAFIGGIGGLALAVLKLIDAKFYLSNVASVEAYAGYLTYAGYMLLGSVAAVFLTDHDLPPVKVKRSAFILGLLAPSVLLAIANQPVKGTDQEHRQAAIPSLSWLPLPSANAQTPAVAAVAAAEAASAIKVEILKSRALQPTFGNAFAAAIGRSELKEPYAYVVGSTPDRAKAVETASKMQEVFWYGGQPEHAKVVQVEGATGYYVLVGDLGSKEDLFKLRTRATSSAIQAIGKSPNLSLEERKKLADLLVNAPVLPASSMLANR